MTTPPPPKTRRLSTRTGLPLGIHQRGPVFQVTITINGNRRSGTAATLPEAVELREALEHEIRGTSTLQPAWSIKTAIGHCYKTKWKDAKSGDKLRSNAEDAALFFGADTPIIDISTERVDSYIEHLQTQGNAGATINRKLAALSAVLTHALHRGESSGLQRKPHLHRQREGQGRIRFLTQEEEYTLLQILSDWSKLDHRDACIVLLDTGLRGSELWNLESRDINFKQGILTIHQSKNDKPRSIPMTQRVREVMERRVDRRPTAKPFPFSNDWLGDTWDRVRAHMNLTEDPQFVPYAMRHTCASRLIQRGAALSVVKEWLGHKTLTVTLRYAHLLPSNLFEAMKVLEQKRYLPGGLQRGKGEAS